MYDFNFTIYVFLYFLIFLLKFSFNYTSNNTHIFTVIKYSNNTEVESTKWKSTFHCISPKRPMLMLVSYDFGVPSQNPFWGFRNSLLPSLHHSSLPAIDWLLSAIFPGLFWLLCSAECGAPLRGSQYPWLCQGNRVSLGVPLTLSSTLLTWEHLRSFITYVFCEYFLPVCGLSFHFLSSVFQRTVVLSLNEVQCMDFLIACAFCVISKKSLLNPRLQVIF